MNAKQSRSIIYVNYSPYENSGRILDYLLEEFTYVFVFSLGFYKLANKKRYNYLLIYERGVQTKEYLLFQLPFIFKFVFLFLPVRSVITFFQILILSYKLKKHYKRINLFFTVNGFASWIGSLLKSLHIVEKTVFWVWDYYPPQHPNFIIRLMRRIYRVFDEVSTTTADRVVFINKRTRDLRRVQGVLPTHKDYPVVPLGTELFYKDHRRRVTDVVYGFIGVLKRSHGLGIVFDSEKEILKTFPHARYEIIGSGPDEKYYRQRAKNSLIKTRFHGYMEGQTYNQVLRVCTIGIATYIPDPSNVSYYGDPGKIKLYLSLGMPVIATDVIEFAAEIQRANAGEIIHSNNPEEFAIATQKIMTNYSRYAQGAEQLAKKYYYKKIYAQLFNF